MNVLTIIKYVFGSAGLAMLIGTAFMHKHNKSFIANAQRAQGTVMELSGVRSSSDDSVTYSPKVSFTTDSGQKIEFWSSTSSNPPSHHEGETVEVLYPADKPHAARINSFFELWGGEAILGGLGSVFFLIGSGIALFTASHEKQRARLIASGTRIQAEFQEVERNESVELNGRHPYRIVAQWINPRTNELHLFRSDNLWFDPSRYIKGSTVTVFIDERNPKRKYHVDTSFLPKLA